MSNMGFNRLILIAPQCELGYPAQQSAATGQFALQNRVNYSSWQDFLENEPEGIKIALTARDGRGRDVKDFKKLSMISRLILPILPLKSLMKFNCI